MSAITSLVSRLRSARRAVALTGAGVSTDSGIPDFRSPTSGFWSQRDPMEVASAWALENDPGGFYEFWTEKFESLLTAKPNPTHELLAKLEERGVLSAVVTQNIDGLHTAAGSRRVMEVHGNFRRGKCTHCHHTEPLRDALRRRPEGEQVPQCTRCGNLFRPDVVLFGELLPPVFAEAEKTVADADLLWVLGSSLGVFPVAGLVPLAQERGVPIAICNRDPTPFDEVADVLIHDELRSTISLVRRGLRDQ